MKCEEGPTRNKKWGILKHLSVEISFEKSAIIRRQTARVSGALGQKLGYDTTSYNSLIEDRLPSDQPIQKNWFYRHSLLSFLWTLWTCYHCWLLCSWSFQTSHHNHCHKTDWYSKGYVQDHLPNHTLLIEIEELSIVPVPMILPDWLPPNFTFPPSFIVRVRNIDLSPVICLEQPLSRYHDFCFSFAFIHFCSIVLWVLWD